MSFYMILLTLSRKKVKVFPDGRSPPVRTGSYDGVHHDQTDLSVIALVKDSAYLSFNALLPHDTNTITKLINVHFTFNF